MHDSDPRLAEPPEGASADPALSPSQAPQVEAEGGTTFTDLRDEVSALVEDARTYAEAELAFQKTRLALSGRHGVRALLLLVLALVLLHIALIALAVGAVIALAPLVTIWGAIGLVVGVMLLGVVLLVRTALGEGRMLGAMFAGDKTP